MNRNLRNTIGAICAITTLLVACSAPQTEENDEATLQEEVQEMASNVFGTYGEEIDTEGAMSPEQLMAKMQHNDTMEVVLEAKINECCKKKGCWMNVAVNEEESMKVTFKDYGFFVPKEGVEGMTAIMRGVATWDTITVEMLQHYAEDGGATTEEIEAITEPELALTFVADGVVIENEK